MSQDTERRSAFARARPIRVAFLVEDGPHAEVMLDAIFAHCNGRWGVRFSLIVPCESGSPRASYLQWLKVYDPDVIYSYVDLTEGVRDRLHDLLGPAYLVRHEPYDEGKRDLRYFRPELPIQCLTSLAVAPQYGRAYPVSAPQPMTIVDYLLGEPVDRFIENNFGSVLSSFGYWPLPEQLADVVRPLYLASEKLRSDRHRGELPEGEFVTDAKHLLIRLSETRNTFGLAQLAADSAPRIDVSGRFDESFHLFIGDSFADRIMFWNDRSRIPRYLGRQFTTLIVSPSVFDDQTFIDALSAFLKNRNGVPRSNGTPWVSIRSVTIASDELSKYRDQLRAVDKWNGYHVLNSVSLDDTPNKEVIDRAARLEIGRVFNFRPSWREFSIDADIARPPMVLPSPLESVQSPSRATQGLWAIDLVLERQNNLTRYSNVQHRWMLPRRLRMHGAFRRPYEIGDSLCYPRASLNGELTLFAAFNEMLPDVTLPDDETAFRYALEQGRDWPHWSSKDPQVPRGAYEWSRPSDKGRYLIGALDLLGGLHAAGAVLLHSFWREIFDDLGAAIGAARHDIIKATLKKRLQQRKIESEDDWDRLTSIVAREAHQARMPMRTLSFEKLRHRFSPYLEKEREFLTHHKADAPEKWLLDAEGSLAKSIKWLCGRTVLYQGYEWRCRKCFNNNWAPLDQLSTTLKCEICKAEQAMPVDRPWDFRLNGFIRDALKEHGLLPLVWCLIRLERRVQTTFCFLGPHELYDRYPEDERHLPSNEADLICVLDGKVHLCEVKSSGRDINHKAIAQVARRIRPDTVTLAVMEKKSRRLEEKVQAIKSELADAVIEVELLTLEKGFKDDARLPAFG